MQQGSPIKKIFTSGRWKLIFTFGVMAVSNLFAWCCLSLLPPFFPLEAQKKGASWTIIGLISSCSELVIFLVSPLFGRLMSASCPRYFYISGLCIVGICIILFGWINHAPDGIPFIAICFAVRVLEAFGTASLLTASFAIATINFPDNVGTIYGILETVTGCGFMLGPAIGGGLYQLGGYSLPFCVLGGCAFACGAVSLALVPSQKYEVTEDKGKCLSIMTLLRSPLVWFGGFGIESALICFTVWNPVFADHLTQFKLSHGVIALIFIICPAIYSFTTPFWGLLLDKKQVPVIPLMLAGLTCSGITLLFFGPAPFIPTVTPSFWLTITTQACLALSLGPVIVSSMKCIVIGARELGFKDDRKQASIVSGIVCSATSLGTFCGPLLGGVLTEYFGYEYAMALSTIWIMAPVICFSPYLCIRG
ncbi:MFS-type transporter SLC18B1-like isoform X1 [Haliotis rufescens]|uniref:MFS-type transporter SLC18B1-like isoform X1 n=1 Tax=Haliotis rufescens TaxID=6454 RepID=UPI001EB0A6EE|nr:MFS-type transporter SLC18B1-like isoform X1 [Haliotis rufescens]